MGYKHHRSFTGQVGPKVVGQHRDKDSLYNHVFDNEMKLVE